MGIIAIRHGQSEISHKMREKGINSKPISWKEIEKIGTVRNKDTEDSGLSEKGKMQIQEISKLLKKYKIDKVYISKMRRVKESYEILEKNYYLPKYQEDGRINAILSGVLHGHIDKESEKYFKLLPAKAIESKQFAYKYQTGESQFKAVQRVYNFLDDTKKFWENKNILIITHKSTLRIIHTYFNEILNDEIYEFNPKNSEILLYGKIFE